MREIKVRNTVTGIYGRSKGSGFFDDAIRYGKLLALTDHYGILSGTKSIVRSYDNKSDLAEIMRSSVKSGGLSESKSEQLKRNFSLERQREQFYDILSRSHYRAPMYRLPLGNIQSFE